MFLLFPNSNNNLSFGLISYSSFDSSITKLLSIAHAITLPVILPTLRIMSLLLFIF